MSTSNINPFAVTSPEKLSAEEAQQLFVEVFTDFPQVEKPGNAMIIGARGSGKSMMFRCLLPDVLMKRNRCDFANLPFVAFHIPIKNTQLKITDLTRIDDNYASALINEHFFTLAVMIEICGQVRQYQDRLVSSQEELKAFYNDVFVAHAEIAGCENVPQLNDGDCFSQIQKCLKQQYALFMRFVASIGPNLQSQIPPYNMPIFTFRMFLAPFLQGLKSLSGFPKGKNVHLFIDDADNLSKTQTQILNSWLGMRLQPDISIKVSTQLGKYKSYLSVDGTLVEAPHDYQRISISDIYTTKKKAYYNRVQEIIAKRLSRAGINLTPEEYFPLYKKQEDEIEKERQRLIAAWETEGRGARAVDDALRYARPNYIKSLGGEHKSRPTYMYAGFFQLVHLSSGVIRVFLETASLMFEEAKKDEYKGQRKKEEIPCSAQDTIVREYAQSELFLRFDNLNKDLGGASGGTETRTLVCLKNLIMSMGRTFYNILVSDRSERRVFSIALTNEPDEEIKAVLDLGVQTGYFHASTIGRKDGSGRTNLYILNRILAPLFNLDPTGFAGYLFVTNDALRGAMYNQQLLRVEAENSPEPEQLTLFD